MSSILRLARPFLPLLLIGITWIDMAIAQVVRPARRPIRADGRRVPRNTIDPLSITFMPGDVIFSTHQGVFEVATHAIAPGPFRPNQLVQHYSERAEYVDLFIFQRPGVFLWFRLGVTDLSFISNLSGAVATFPAPGADPLIYSNVRCAHYLRTSPGSEILPSLPSSYQNFVQSLIREVSINPQIFITPEQQIMNALMTTLMGANSALATPTFLNGQYTFLDITRMNFAEEGEISNVRPIAWYVNLIQDFSRRTGFLPIRRVFRATINPILECPGSRNPRAMYTVAVPDIDAMTQPEKQQAFPWFYNYTGGSFPWVISAIDRLPWDELQVAAFLTGVVELVVGTFAIGGILAGG